MITPLGWLPDQAQRTLIGVVLSLSCPLAAISADRFWITNTPGALWHDNTNWAGALMPNGNDTAYIGVNAAVEDSHVRIGGPVFVSDVVLSDGMALLNLNGVGDPSPITAFGNASVTQGSALRVFRGASAYDFRAVSLNLHHGAELDLRNDAIANLDEVSTNNHARIEGVGVVNLFGSGTNLVNDGRIEPHGVMTLNQMGDGLFDLDGAAGDGELHVDGDGPFVGDDLARLTLNGQGLSDSFSGRLYLRNGRRLIMNLTDGWSTSPGAEITVRRGFASDGSAQIQGDHFTLRGQLTLEDEAFGQIVWTRVTANTTIEPMAQVDLGSESLLSFYGTTTINGGQLNLAEGTQFLDFTGSAYLRGGEFTTHSDSIADGSVQFRGPTDWGGVVTLNGVARQIGDAVVSGPTVIHADRFDMDGAPESMGGLKASWQVDSGLIVNAQNIDTGSLNDFDSVISVGGGVSPRLTINLADPDAHWTMSGEMNLTGHHLLFRHRVAGSRMEVAGQLTVAERARITADLDFREGSTLTLATTDDRLRVDGVTRVEAGALFAGEGRLRNSATGRLTLSDGVETEGVDLSNHGLLDIGGATGIATVDDFENQLSGTLAIDIGGDVLGETFDHLMVTGAAQIDGVLAVDLLEDELGPNGMPSVGDEFLILTSLEGVSGSFTDVLPTHALGNVYSWEAIYDQHNITIRLASIDIAVPEPPGVALAACVFSWALLWRR